MSKSRSYDWNESGGEKSEAKKNVELNDETLRDGLQSPSIVNPTLEEKLGLLHLMSELGIHWVNIGYPGAGIEQQRVMLRLAEEIRDWKLPIKPRCIARTHKADIVPALSISQRAGIPITVGLYIGASPIRQYVEGWSLDVMVERVKESIEFVVREGFPCGFGTEDTIRSHPDVIKRLYTIAIEEGAKYVTIADTVGHATPEGTKNIVGYIRRIVQDTNESVTIDWHGHNDRGLSVANSIAAVEAGANRVHACGLGIGERTGNTPMEILIVNLNRLGYLNFDLRKLPKYCLAVSKATKIPIPSHYPVVETNVLEGGASWT